LLELLRGVKQQVSLTVIAGLEDKVYWEQCRQLIKHLPGNVKVNIPGELQHHEVEQQLLAHHVFVLPTKGENFGHAIFEALAAGRPSLISDQTPWRNLQQSKAGWDLPLSEPAAFAAAIEEAASMSNEQLNEWCTGAWNFCRDYIERSGIKEQYIKLFS
jgi:glycosyltransferase involved in cell wall biosynthesis